MSKSTLKNAIAEQKAESHILIIDPVKQMDVELCIIGETSLLTNRFATKAMHELLLPLRKTRSGPKHNPIEEFRSSAYTVRSGPTLLSMPATAFKGALCSAALDIGGTTKAAIGRLTYVPGEQIPIYGIPELHMGIVRMADIKRTPDVRTRLILTKWAAKVIIRFATPMLNQQAILNLFSAAGIIIGVGEWRQGKGSGNHGLWKITNEHDPEYQNIIKSGGRKQQEEAMANPVCVDDETSELFAWCEEQTRLNFSKGDKSGKPLVSRVNGEEAAGEQPQ
jgi:hypothetical protein